MLREVVRVFINKGQILGRPGSVSIKNMLIPLGMQGRQYQEFIGVNALKKSEITFITTQN